MSMTIEEKLAAVMVKLRQFSRYYSIMYSKLPKVEVESIETMGVNMVEIIYNKEFVESKSVGELIFINLHEIAHFALMHPARIKDRDHHIFNIACDLYVNKLICEEFGWRPGTKVYQGTTEIVIPAANTMVYSDDIDIDTDTVEELYERLKSMVHKKKDGIYMDVYEPKENNSRGMYRHNKEGMCVPKNKEEYTKTGEVKISDRMSEVFVSIGDKNNSEKTRQIEGQIKRILREVNTQSKMYGNNPGRLETRVEEILVAKVNWSKLVKKYLIQDIQRESSFHTTDKRMSYQEAIFPGMYTPNDGKLERLKVCIDTSGSISDKRLAVFVAQLKQLLNKYKVSAELIFWDTEISAKGNFNNYEELKKIQPKGRGGTDPNCLFKYFESKECKIKPSLIIVFTDGYFYMAPDEAARWKRKFKNVLWIIEERSKTEKIEMPFGKVTVFDD